MPNENRSRSASPERRFVTFTAAAGAAVVWAHAVAALLRHLGPDAAPLAALPLTLSAVGVAATLLFGLAAAGLAFAFGRRSPRLERAGRAAGWLAILGLGSLASGGAWGDYVPLVATWLLPLLAARGGWTRVETAWLGACWLFQYTLLGTSPLGNWGPPAVLIPLSLVAALLLFGVFFGTLFRLLRKRPARAEAREPEAASTAERIERPMVAARSS